MVERFSCTRGICEHFSCTPVSVGILQVVLVTGQKFPRVISSSRLINRLIRVSQFFMHNDYYERR